MSENRIFDENEIVFVWLLSHDKRPVRYYTPHVYDTIDEILAIDRLSETLRTRIKTARIGTEIDVCYYSMQNRLLLKRLSVDEIKLLNDAIKMQEAISDVNTKIYAATKDLQSQKKFIEKEYKKVKETLESKNLTHRF